MRDYFRSRSTMQLPSTVDNFRQHLLHHNTSFIAFSMNELKTNAFKIPAKNFHISLVMLNRKANL